jgi:phosphotransferase system enzyme I (PtsI)
VKKLIGIGASPGIAIGMITHLNDDTACELALIQPGTPDVEQQRFMRAQEQALEQLAALEERTKQKIGEAEAQVFSAQALMLKDPMLESAVTEKIAAALSAEEAVQRSTVELSDMLSKLEDEYLRTRAADVQDIGKRLVRILQGKLTGPEISGIVVADDLLPSDTAMLNLEIVQGFVTAAGGRTSHSSIIARTAGIPAVVGIGEAVMGLSDHSRVIIDGDKGIVYIDPSEQLVTEFQLRLATEQQTLENLAASKMLPAITRNGDHLEVAANIGTPQDMAAVVHAGADGVGLFRTEFLFLQRGSLPTEAEQIIAYQTVLSAMPDKKIVIRTLDAGGDKELPYLAGKPEANPALGLRAIRLCLAHKDVFKTQLRALLQASVMGNLYIMFPMIATLEELLSAKAILAEAKQELTAENIPFQANIPVGIMIEVPAAAVNADLLIDEVDFFSIGTNDLVQYTMAADRMNDQVANLSDYFQPAVLRLIQLVTKAAAPQGKWVGMCGEMAGDPLATPLLVGLGITELSMSPRAVATVKQRIRQLDTFQAQSWVKAALKLKKASAVRQYLTELAKQLDPHR